MPLRPYDCRLLSCTTDILSVAAGAGTLRAAKPRRLRPFGKAATRPSRTEAGAEHDMLATDKMSVVHKDIHAAPALRLSPPVLYDGHLVRRRWGRHASSRKAALAAAVR
jgi:hypothetical protein